jgi:hypothetical protein
MVNQKQAKFMECDLKRWVVMEVEPHVWFVMVVNKAWAGPGCSNESLASSIASLHALFILLHRPLHILIDQVMSPCMIMLTDSNTFIPS